MLTRCLAAILLAAATLSAHAQAAKSQAYVLSGVNGTQFSVDDGFILQVNGVEIYNDGTAQSGLRGPINFITSPGAALTFAVHDTYGFCNGLDPLVISCKNSKTYTPVTPGLPETCGHPQGDNGIVFSGSYTIPMVLPGCTASTIASVEVTQAIQQYQALVDLETSLSSSGEPPVPIIANKPAVLRVYFAPVTDASQVTLTLTGTLSGSKSISLQPNCSPTDQRAGNNGCQSADFYFTPPTGAWNVTLTLTDSSGNQLQQEVLNFTSRTTASLILSGVNACLQKATGDLAKTCGNGFQVYSLLQSTQALMPTASVTPSFDFGNVSTYDLASPDIYYLQKILATQADELYGGLNAVQDYNGNSRTNHVAVYQPTPTSGSTAWTAYTGAHGLTIPSKFITLGVDDTADTLAHEVGHTLNLQHTNSVTPMTTAAPGCDHIAASPISTYPFPNNYIQSTATTPEYGFNVTTQTIINGYTNFELMGYCTPSWITPYDYKIMIAALNGGPVTSASAHPAPAAAQPKATPPTPVAGQFWQIAGTVPATGLIIDPVFLQTTTGTTDPGTGAYSIQVRNAAGTPLFTRAFSLNTTVGDPTAANPTTTELTTFSQWIPYTAGAASFAILDPTSAVLTTLPITGATPTVAFTNLAGFTATGAPTLTWSITDPDSTAFSSRVVYSPDSGVNWYPVSQTTQTGTAPGALTTGTDTIDFTTLPGSATALLRVYVTDGVNTGVATSAPFNAPRHLPTSVIITSPVSGITQAAANPVILTGSAFDPDDGFLLGQSLVWSSDIQGALGTGSPLSAALKPGTHTLTLTATDSDGNAITATSKITLGGAAPVLTLTTKAVTAACTNATIAATPGAQGAPLATVQYSLDGGVTYTTIPLANLPYTFLVPGTGAINLVARAYDASNQLTAQSTRLTLTGTCVTQTLTALSGSGQFVPVTGTFAPLKAQLLDYAGNPIPGVTINFSAPTGTVASATLTPANVVTAADGTATTTPTANTLPGSYTVTATGPSGTATLTAPFNLTNTDFSILAAQPAVTIQHGASLADTITLTALGGFNSSVAFTCTNLPAGVTCSFSPSNLTPSGGTGTTVLTIATTQNAKSAALLQTNPLTTNPITSTLATCTLLILVRRRKRLATILTLTVAFIALSTITGCGGFPAFTSTITVNATYTTGTSTVVRTTPIAVHIQ